MAALETEHSMVTIERFMIREHKSKHFDNKL